MIKRDVIRAKKYYTHSLRLADDVPDIATACRTLEQLGRPYLTCIKLDTSKGVDGRNAERRPKSLVGDEIFIDRTMVRINLRIFPLYARATIDFQH